jgi:hypothetical protein
MCFYLVQSSPPASLLVAKRKKDSGQASVFKDIFYRIRLFSKLLYAYYLIRITWE